MISPDRRLSANKNGEWIEPSKVPHFKVLFDRIKDRISEKSEGGAYHKAMDATGLSDSTMNGITNGKLSVRTARGILLAYKKHCR